MPWIFLNTIAQSEWEQTADPAWSLVRNDWVPERYLFAFQLTPELAASIVNQIDLVISWHASHGLNEAVWETDLWGTAPIIPTASDAVEAYLLPRNSAVAAAGEEIEVRVWPYTEHISLTEFGGLDADSGNWFGPAQAMEEDEDIENFIRGHNVSTNIAELNLLSLPFRVINASDRTGEVTWRWTNRVLHPRADDYGSPWQTDESVPRAFFEEFAAPLAPEALPLFQAASLLHRICAHGGYTIIETGPGRWHMTISCDENAAALAEALIQAMQDWELETIFTVSVEDSTIDIRTVVGDYGMSVEVRSPENWFV